MISIQSISATETWPIRHKVMWPNEPLDYVKLTEDENGLHFGLFEEDKLVAIVSLFIAGSEAQFRKLATLEAAQGKGYASQLIQHILDYCRSQELDKVWCNARLSKSSFYQKFGMAETSDHLWKKGIEYVVMEIKLK